MTAVTLESLSRHAKHNTKYILLSAHTSSCKVTSICSFLYSSSKDFESTICTIFYISIASIYSVLGILSWQEELTLRSIQRNNMNLLFPNSNKVKMKSHWCVLRPDYKNCQKALL